MAVEDVVAEHERGGIVAYEVGADMIGLREAVRLGLDRIADLHAEIAAVAEQRLERALLHSPESVQTTLYC